MSRILSLDKRSSALLNKYQSVGPHVQYASRLREKEIIKEFLEYQKGTQILSPLTRPADLNSLTAQLSKNFEIKKRKRS